MEHFGAVFKLDLTKNKDAIQEEEAIASIASSWVLPHTGYAYGYS